MKYFIFLILSLHLRATASTFVGNGGNAGDIELQVAINQIKATLKLIQENAGEPDLKLCTCYERFKEQPVCNNLTPLKKEQVQYCSEQILKNTAKLIDLLEDNRNLQFSWTNKNIQVKEKEGLRGADAVTDASSKTITINQDNFISLKPSQRIFLIAHELFHLIKVNDSYFADDEEYPHFSGRNGGRTLINAMASAITVESYDYGTFTTYGRPLSRSQNIKSHWISTSAISQAASATQPSAYEQKSLSGLTLGYRYQFNQWGVVFNYASAQAKKGILTASNVEEKRDWLGIGASYRWFPFVEPLTFLGQSHFVFTAAAEFMTGKVSLSDSFIGLDESVSSNSWSVGGNYFIPFSRGLWGFLSLDYSAHQLNFQKFNLAYSSGSTTLGLGVAYAF